jgi:ubiquinone/menaquinone biosynthesis C-methylase UbiE
VHHLRLFSFYEREFLPRLGEGLTEGGREVVADLGSGSGIWSRFALDAHPGLACVGVDISPTSVDEARRMAASTGFAARSEFVLGDATAHRLVEPAHAAISSFLLEHLERPEALLDNLAANLAQGGYAWITAALTAAEIDHITEFRRESEIVRLVEDAGLRVIATLSETPRAARSKLRFVPRSMAVVAQKRRNDIW